MPDFSHGATRLAAALLTALLLSGQPASDPAAGVEKLNQEIAAQMGRSRERASSGKPLTELLAERRRLMVELIQWRPSEAVRLAFSPELAGQIRAAGSSDIEQHGEWEGVAAGVAVADDFEKGRASISIPVRVGEEILEVHPLSPPGEIRSGATRVALRGFRIGGVAVGEARFSYPGQPGEEIQCRNTGEQRFLVIPARGPEEAPPASLALAPDVFFSEEAPSLASHVRENSYGKAWITGKVLEPVQLSRTYGPEEMWVLASDALKAAGEKEDLSLYSRFVFVYSFRTLPSYTSGGGSLGCADYGTGQPASLMWLRDSVFYSRRPAAAVAAHEAGHNFGLMHASTREFPAATLERPGNPGMRTEYGSVFSPMGPIETTFPHFHALEKLRIGWIDPSEVAEIQEEGETVLGPLGQAATLFKAARILRDEDREEWLWVEFRKPDGSYEGSLPAFADTGAVVYLEDGSETERRGSFLLDFTPETPPQLLPWDRNRTLHSRRSWQDLYTPLRLEVSVDGDALTVKAVRSEPCHGLATDLSIIEPGEASGEIRILAPPDCPWEVRSFASWLRLEGPTEGVGPATIPYKADAIDDWTNRGGAIVVSGLTHRVLQLFPGAGPSGAEVRPAEGEGETVEIEADWHHPDGPEEIHAVRFSLAASPGAAGGCTIEYYPHWPALRQMEDDGNWGDFNAFRWAAVNYRRCRILYAVPIYAGPTGPVRLRIRLQIASWDPGQYGIFLSSTDRRYRTLDWFQAGAWTVKEAGKPTLTDFAGFEAGGGPELWIQGKLSNPRGIQDTKLLRFVIVDRADLGHSCAVEIDMENYLIRLGWSPEEDWTPWSGFIGSGMLSNERCKFQEVIWAGLSDPREWWLGFGVKFFPVFAGRKEVFAQIVSRDGTEWDWTVLGEWEVRFPAP